MKTAIASSLNLLVFFLAGFPTPVQALPSPATFVGDINGDYACDFQDLLPLAQLYGQTVSNSPADINEDGIVEFSDLSLLAQNYNIGFIKESLVGPTGTLIEAIGDPFVISESGTYSGFFTNSAILILPSAQSVYLSNFRANGLIVYGNEEGFPSEINVEQGSISGPLFVDRYTILSSYRTLHAGQVTNEGIFSTYESIIRTVAGVSPAVRHRTPTIQSVLTHTSLISSVVVGDGLPIEVQASDDAFSEFVVRDSLVVSKSNQSAFKITRRSNSIPPQLLRTISIRDSHLYSNDASQVIVDDGSGIDLSQIRLLWNKNARTGLLISGGAARQSSSLSGK